MLVIDGRRSLAVVDYQGYAVIVIVSLQWLCRTAAAMVSHLIYPSLMSDRSPCLGQSIGTDRNITNTMVIIVTTQDKAIPLLSVRASAPRREERTVESAFL